MLNQQQSSLLNAIFSGQRCLSNHENNSQNEGLEIYQRSLLANAARALAITFATVHSYIGNSAFNVLVEAYLKAEMKQEYDWGELGSSFATFISSQHVSPDSKNSIENTALLASVAELDFACHKAERSKNVNVDLSTLSLLSEVDAYELYLTLCAGTALVSSSIPLDEVNDTISQLTDEKKISNLDDVTRLLTAFSQQYITNEETDIDKILYHFVVWRPDFQANYSRISADEYQWLSLLLAQKNMQQISIGQALDEINNEAFSFVEWLPKAITERLINGINVKHTAKT